MTAKCLPIDKREYQFSETVLWIQSPEAPQILGFAIQNRQSKIQS